MSLLHPEETGSVLDEVGDERRRQDERWGLQQHAPAVWLSILGEEYGEACRGLNENDMENYRQELIQVAAVACAAIESLDRQVGQA